jgi:flagellar protein FlgJ
MNGIPTDRLQAYAWRSTTEKNSRFWEGEFERMWEDGTLTADDVNQPGVPFNLRQEYLTRVKALDDQRGRAGMGNDDLKRTFESALRPLIKATSTDSSPHFSLGLATNHAVALYNRSFKRYAATMDPGQASQQAMNDVLNQIQKGGGTFTVVDSVDGSTDQSFFAAFTPGGHKGAPRFSTPLDVSAGVNKFAKNPSIIEKEVFVDKALLKDINDRVEKGRPISIPRIYYDMARVKPDMNAVDILNEQLKAAGFTAQVGGGAMPDSQINDPRLQEILKMPTQANVNTAIIGSGHAPSRIRQGADGFQDIMAITQLAGHKFPMLAAAQWALESGYGSAQSGRHNYFGIKGGGSTVSTQEFVNGQMVTVNASFRDYNSPLESAKDYVALTQNSRYAPGLAAARTPREAAMAIKAAGYATDPNYVNKLVNIMKGQGINVDAPYDYQGPPTRNPAYMTPTVAYKIYGIGPTSTGPHLDVKQVGGGRFAENALDGFVSVQMGGRRVPLSAVQVTDGFDDHVARGSLGRDYAAPAGAPVRVSGGARVVSRASTEHGDKLVIQLPDGRRFSFLHGKAV